jgi:2',3'-cyclic-nucleotide 2'-phosphodiesterase (5'-nucleotidase family)
MKQTKHNNRRHFLKTLGLGAGTALAGVHSLASAQDSSSFVPTPYQEKTIRKVSIFQTTDVHCQVFPHDELFWENDKAVFRKTGGYANLATLFKTLRKQHPDSFFIDTGDMFQGSELSVKTTGKAIVPILNYLNYNLYLPGNWEVVFGKRNMQQLMGSLLAPKLCANMYHDLGEGRRGELIFPPYYIWQTGGVKVGFLGYTDHLVPLRQSPLYSKGIVYAKPEENLTHYVDVLRNQEQCAFVIILAHLGLSQQIKLSNMPECEGVNYILGGDTHERVRTPLQGKYAKVVEPGAFGSFVGHLELTLQNGQVIADSYKLLEVNATGLKPDKELTHIIEKAEMPFLDDLKEVIGYSTVPLYRYFVIENTIDTLILDALAWSFPEVDIVLSNGFRFCPPLATPDKSGNIPITSAFLYDMLPVDSNIKMGKVSGKQLLEWMEKELNNVFASDAAQRFGGWVVKFKGMKLHFNAFGESGKRVLSLSVGNKPVEPEASYSILAREREGDPDDMMCRMKGVRETSIKTHTLHQAIKAYLKQHSPVTPLPQGNAIASDAPAHLLTQVSGVPYQFY